MIRPLAAKDAPCMTRLHGTAFDPAWPEPDMVGHISSDLGIGFGDPLAGFILIRQIADQSEILTIVTDPSQRRQGIARRLIGAGMKNAAQTGAAVMFLEVAEDNAAAIELYKSVGFSRIGRRPAYYRRPGGRIAALTFRKELDATAAAG